MANNRMYIKCRVCGEEICLAKHFGNEWGLCSMPINDKSFEERMDAFFRKHYIEHALEEGVCDTNCFELSYESEDADAEAQD